ncbi:hypothetical protein GGR50DRAFT_70454 [Xylaria sp. CBS 124048]|nr:hypothetical protein GGR50DRAFT_70454 [Xylaria sp. CBS 124048]
MRASLDSSRPIMAPSVRSTRIFSITSGLSRSVRKATCRSDSPTIARHGPRLRPSPRVHRVACKSNLSSPKQLVSPRASLRFSTYSAAPSLATVQTNDSAHAEIRNIESGLARMENKALAQQRVMLSEEKTDKLGKLALGAKLDRALDRRMKGQDAEMRTRKTSLSEKETLA